MALKARREVAPEGERGLRRWDYPADSPFDVLLRGRDGLQRQLDRLFTEYWQGTERKTVLADHRALKKNQLASYTGDSFSMTSPRRSTGNGTGKE